MKHIKKIIKFIVVVSIALLVLIASYYLYQLLQRPSAENITQELWKGVQYQRVIQTKPRKNIIHIVTVDLKQKGVRLLVTPEDTDSELDLFARTTSEFVKESGVQVAINGAFFNPFYSNGPLDFAPRSGEGADVLGLAISNGKTYSQDYLDWSVFCVTESSVQISVDGCPKDTQQALAGRPLIIQEGKLTNNLQQRSYAKSPQPRSVIALNKARDKLWMIVVDGRQKGYSEGLNLRELGDYLMELGVEYALNLDGGGSSTLVINKDGGVRPLNAPYHTKVPMRERPVANHLGVFVGE